MSELWRLGDTPGEGQAVSDVLLRELIGVYYQEHPTGGHGHIVFDEGDVEDSHVRFCIQEALVHADWVCAGLLLELLKRHPKQREAIVAQENQEAST